MVRISKPAPDEHHPYYAKYITLVGDDALVALRSGCVAMTSLLANVPEAKAMFRYEPGKWSVKEVVGHVIDCERVFAYRALHFARADATPLPGFEENDWVPAGRFDRRPLADLVAEYSAVRNATLAFFDSLDADDLLRRGKANDAEVSVRALAHIMAGHELHHMGLLRERYGLA
jgi:uncharacterized damage-inducible protein DinB